MREDDPKTCKNPIVLLTMIQTLSDDFEDVQIISKAQFEELVIISAADNEATICLR